jgi:hypothetical protein
MLAKEDREYVLQETAAISAELRIVYNILENISLRMDCIEDFALQHEKYNNDWHYDTACKCDKCSGLRDTFSGRFDDANDYRMD